MEQKGAISKWTWAAWMALCLLWAASAAYDWSLHRWVSPLSIILMVIFLASAVMSLRGGTTAVSTIWGPRERAFFTLGVVLAAAAIIGTQVLLQSLKP